MADDFSDFVIELKERADIVSVINRYVPLKKRGARFLGLCPFHSDHSPSFNVTPQMGIYKCFVCGEGGDIIKFVQEYEKVGFMDALKIVADELGMTIPKMEFKPGSKDREQKISHILDLNSLAGAWFQKQLEKARQVLKYLEIRGISDSSRLKFQMGFAPGGWDAFLKYGRSKGYDDQQLLDAGLVVRGKNRIYDRFVNRLIFPIWNQSNRIVGFGGRTLEKAGKPKYLNSPETALYQKSKILYGFNFARKTAVQKGTLILVEGYMDLLALSQIDIHNVAAVSGTALTNYHVAIISKFSRKVVLLLDGDNAGVAAAMRSLPMLLGAGIEVTIPFLPTSEDPDSFIRKNGAEAMKKLLENGRDIISFLTSAYTLNPKEFSPEAKQALFKDCSAIVNRIPTPMVRDEYLNRLCNALNISKRYLPPPPPSAPSPSFQTHQKPIPQIIKLPKSIETRLLQLVISHSHLCEITAQKLELEWIEIPQIREILDFILDFFENQTHFNLTALFDGLSDFQKGIMESIEPLEIKDIDILKKEVTDTIQGLERRFVRKSIKTLSKDYRNGTIDRSLGLSRVIEYQKRLLELEQLKTTAYNHQE